MVKRTGSSSLDSDVQLTHYWIKPTKKQKKSFFSSLFNLHQKHNGTPFFNLAKGKESDADMIKRYEIYKKVWKYQSDKISQLLNNANTQLFDSLLEYIESDGSTTDNIKKFNHKQSVAFLLLSSNNANNLRILEELSQYLKNSKKSDNDGKVLKIINLNSKNCANIKSSLREVVKQFLSLQDNEEVVENPSENDDVFDEGSDEESGPESEDSDVDDELHKNNLPMNESNNEKVVDIEGRVSYDLDVIEDWCYDYFNQEKSTLATTNLRVTLIIQDSDSISDTVLNQIIKLVHSYSNKIPIKLIIGLSSHNVSSWINSHLSNDVRVIINGLKFKSNNNRDLGYLILNELFLNHELSDENPLAVDCTLSSILLSRFENSNNSIDTLISEIKLCYMIYYYQLPLSLLSTAAIKASPLHIDYLRKLPSFKQFIELKVSQLEEKKKSILKIKELIQLSEKNDDLTSNCKKLENEIIIEKKEISNLIGSDKALISKFNEARVDFHNYIYFSINAVNILYIIQIEDKKEKFEIYKLITNNQLLHSVYLKNIFKKLNMLSADELMKLIRTLIDSPDILDTKDKSVLIFKKNLSSIASVIEPTKLINEVKSYLDTDKLKISLDNVLFNEVFSMSGGKSEFDQRKKVEEMQDNLMLNLVRPNTREIIELGLNESESYLANEMIGKGIDEKAICKPLISFLFNIYKDAPVSINIYDFYVAFRQSLGNSKLLKELEENVIKSDLPQKERLLKILNDENLDWDKITYAWFVQNAFELIMIGTLKEKSKGDYLEKAIWRGV